MVKLWCSKNKSLYFTVMYLWTLWFTYQEVDFTWYLPLTSSKYLFIVHHIAIGQTIRPLMRVQSCVRRFSQDEANVLGSVQMDLTADSGHVRKVFVILLHTSGRLAKRAILLTFLFHITFYCTVERFAKYIRSNQNLSMLHVQFHSGSGGAVEKWWWLLFIKFFLKPNKLQFYQLI